MYDSICPVSFEYPVYGNLAPYRSHVSEPCWFNINFPSYRGTIHLSYLEIDNSFDRFIEENWRIIYGGVAKRADAVEEYEYNNPEKNLYGMIYEIKGDAASAIQFYATDSVKHLLRGSLYFLVKPNYDSLAPVVSFFREDVIHLMKSVRWKEVNKK